MQSLRFSRLSEARPNKAEIQRCVYQIVTHHKAVNIGEWISHNHQKVLEELLIKFSNLHNNYSDTSFINFLSSCIDDYFYEHCFFERQFAMIKRYPCRSKI